MAAAVPKPKRTLHSGIGGVARILRSRNGTGGTGQGLQGTEPGGQEFRGWSHGPPVGLCRDGGVCGLSTKEQWIGSGAQVSGGPGPQVQVGWGRMLAGLGCGHKVRGWSQGSSDRSRSSRRWSPQTPGDH